MTPMTDQTDPHALVARLRVVETQQVQLDLERGALLRALLAQVSEPVKQFDDTLALIGFAWGSTDVTVVSLGFTRYASITAQGQVLYFYDTVAEVVGVVPAQGTYMDHKGAKDEVVLLIVRRRDLEGEHA